MRSHDEVDRLLPKERTLTQRLAPRTIWVTLLVHRWIDQSVSDSVWEFSDHFPFERRVTGLGENSTNGSCLARMQASAQIELDRLESSSVRCRFHYTRPILCSVRRGKKGFLLSSMARLSIRSMRRSNPEWFEFHDLRFDVVCPTDRASLVYCSSSILSCLVSMAMRVLDPVAADFRSRWQ